MGDQRIAIIGGTGKLGVGLALRWAVAGVSVILGSRDGDRAAGSAKELGARLPAEAADIAGAENVAAAAAGDLAVLAVPYDSALTLTQHTASALAGKVLVSAVVPLGFDKQGPYLRPIEAGPSVAEAVATTAPEARVVAGLHSVAAGALAKLDTGLDEDVLLCGDDEAALIAVAQLVRLLPGAVPVVAGPLRLAGAVEGFTAALIGVNKRHGAHVGLRLTRLPASPRPPE